MSAVALLAGAAHAAALKPPSHFVAGGANPALLEGVREHTADRIDFARRFTLTFVPCGIGCGSFWFVDRRTGGVIAAPPAKVDGEDTWEVEAKPDSNVIRVIYGPRDGGFGVRCAARRFRWSGKAFVPVDERAVILCPE